MSNTDALRSSEEYEWYTDAAIFPRIRAALGGPIDLDPASSAEANEVVGATRFFTIEDDGLLLAWHAERLFINPPYGRNEANQSRQAIWSQKLIEEVEAGHIGHAIGLFNSQTGERWFQPLREAADAMAFTTRRMRFRRPRNSTAPRNGPTHGNVFVYFGADPHRFLQVMCQDGYCWPHLPVRWEAA